MTDLIHRSSKNITEQSNIDTKLNDAKKDIAHANGVPNKYYIADDAFRLEQKKIFNKGWYAIGYCSYVQEPGTVYPVQYFNDPMLIVKSKEDCKIRVFQNVCRHRGMKLVEEPSVIKGAIRCPYHSWCYNQQGNVIATPHIGGPGYNFHQDVDKSNLNLFEIRSHIWRNVVFVNPDGDAPPFEEVHQDLLERWKCFEKKFFTDSNESAFTLNVNGNWKLAVENYLEAYHLPWVHPGLNSYSKLEDHDNIVQYGKYSGQISNKYIPRFKTGKSFDDFEGLSHEWDTKGEYIVLFPNLILGVQRDHVFNLIIEPTSPNSIKEHVEIYYSNLEMLSEEYLETRKENAELWKTVFEEDIFVVEGMQKGRYASHFDGGRFSPVMDQPTHVFHDWYADKINS